MKHIHIIGLGLIGGSFALAIRKAFPEVHISGFDKNDQHLEEAQYLGLIDEVSEKPSADTDIVLLATPVDVLPELSKKLLDEVNAETLIIDLGSTKATLCKHLSDHPKRGQFLAGHPIAGTEYSGPRAAKEDLLNRKVFIICEMEKTDVHLKGKAYELFEALNLKLRFMDPEEHDLHLAFVSHLSHISSFMLGKTVMDKMEDERHIFDMAGSGFASTVRLAKSSPEMWTPILKENKTHVLEALGCYIEKLKNLENSIKRDDFESVYRQLKEVGPIREIMDMD
ncbi:prephenate dehydrogenase [Litoribacter alkaliphilus]|uniref:Prephenate dehydrogenase n=1 Tax=Litoribacter ruber TaxID=702568 RepID=A0AAP2CIX2_9BACT|nr:prephenate dehydrogenase [Litoribacter alkaliphilus]MBS9524066.1 prephenate dehydrogenase [Litoribacter alkaliphilus]